MQQLRVVARLFPAIERGEKRVTIRWREQHIAPGPMRYVHADDPARTAVVQVMRCTDMPLCDAAAFLGQERAWPRDVMLEGMRAHYLAIQWDDSVQVIKHLPPQEDAPLRS